MELRLAHPGDDAVSKLLTARAEDRLTTHELVSLCQLLTLAGAESTVNLIGVGVKTLLRGAAGGRSWWRTRTWHRERHGSLRSRRRSSSPAECPQWMWRSTAR